MNWLRERANTIALLTGGVIAFFGLAMLAVAMLSTTAVVTTDEFTAERDKLIAERDVAVEDLNTAHLGLGRSLDRVNYNRVQTDTATVRDIVLALTSTSESHATTDKINATLVAQLPVLNESSSVLTTFLPSWLATKPAGQFPTYRLTDLNVQVIGPVPEAYTYFAIARLDEVVADDKEPLTQFVAVTVTISVDGTVTAIDANLASQSSRDAIIANDPEDEG